MKNGFRIGSLFGIDIRIDWSWLIILGLVSWSLSTFFGQAHPGWTGYASWGMAIFAAFLFFSSVLVHELAHSLVARAKGVPVRNITLFMFGGVSNIQREPSSPMTELLVTIVGPISSFALGAGFLLLGSGSIALSGVNLTNMNGFYTQIGPFSTILIWLGSINILVGLFNLIPGFPLDGGRIIRAILWGLSDDLSKATRWAARLGQLIAFLIIAVGLAMLVGLRIPFFGGGFVNGIWLIFIGWFLQNAALLSYRKTLIQDVLDDVPVSRIMYKNVPVAPAGISIETLVNDYLMKSENRVFIIHEGENTIGLITIDDVRKVSPEDRKNTLVQNVMTPADKMIVVNPDEEAADALNRLQSEDIRQLPVVSGNKIIGLLRRKDIIRWLQFQSQLG